MMFDTIVLALDGSASSDVALRHAAELAKAHRSRVHVVHVVEVAAARGAGPLHVDSWEHEEKIEQQVEALADDGMEISVQVYEAIAGRSAQLIAGVAEEVGADLIVAGIRGRAAVAGIFLGSIAQRLIGLARCPVLIIPESSDRERVAGRV